MIDYDKIFNQIVEASNSKKKDVTTSKNFLKTDIIGNSITGRFVANFKDIINSVYAYAHHGWTSKLDGYGLFFLCPSTVKQNCPICQRSIKMWKSGDKIQQELSKNIRRRQNWLVNFLVVNNPKNPEDNGTVKILRMGKQLHDKYVLATEGEDKESYGKRVFMLDENGCNFRIKCDATSEKGGDKIYPSYNNSGFLPNSKIEGMTEEKIQQILTSVFDLTKLFELKTYKDLSNELETTYFANEIQTLTPTPPPASAQKETVITLESKPAPEIVKPAVEQITPAVATVAAKTPVVVDDQIDQMLADLQRK